MSIHIEKNDGGPNTQKKVKNYQRESLQQSGEYLN